MVLRNRTEFCILAVLVLIAGIVAGCGSKSAQDTKTPAQPLVGIIDIQTVVNNHPKYSDLQRLQQEYTVLASQAQAMAGQAGGGLPASGNGAAGLNAAAAQEFSAKMAAKEKELGTRLSAAEEEQRQALKAELDAYISELDKTYQPQIFSIQLKLKTVQLSKEEAAAPQAELERLQNERSAKLAARQQELAQKLEQDMTAKKADLGRQLDAYGQQLHATMAGDLAAKQAELAGQAVQQPDGSGQTDAQQRLAMKEQEIRALQDFITSDVRDKAAKVAAEKGLEAVFANVRVNVSAVDVTAAVIAEFKK